MTNQNLSNLQLFHEGTTSYRHRLWGCEPGIYLSCNAFFSKEKRVIEK